MYEGFYNLKENPFRLSPDPAYMYLTVQHREALAGLLYSAFTRPGLTVLVGEAGTGKTTLLYSLVRALERQRFIVALCNNPTLTRDEFYDLLLVKLGVDCVSALKSRQLLALQDALLRYRADGRRAILIVDEAQRLSPELLEEIRLLGNVETPREKLLDIVMAGQPELAETLGRPELRQLKQRISRICRLEPLSAEDVRHCVNHRLAKAGLADQKLFSNETIQAIFAQTGGIPRLVNSLCDGALQTGFALQSPQITTAIVLEAARDLELKAQTAGWEVRSNGQSRVSPGVDQPVPSVAQPARGSAQYRNLFQEYPTTEKPAGFFAKLMGRRN
jgi:general secretion pathway protein A